MFPSTFSSQAQLENKTINHGIKVITPLPSTTFRKGVIDQPSTMMIDDDNFPQIK
jgi:hypothetical protein